MTNCLLVSAPFSGIEVHFELLAEHLAASDRIDQLDAIWLRHDPVEFLSRHPPINWSWYTAAAWSTSRQFRAIRRSRSRPDVALFNQMNPALFLNPLSRMPPIVLHLDTTPIITASMGGHYLRRAQRHPAVEKLKLAIYQRTFAAARHIIAVSELVRRSLIDDYSIDPQLISVIPYSVDTAFFSLQPGLPNRDDALRILFVGGEFQRKGGQILLEAARLPAFADCEFHVVTKSPIPDPPDNFFVHRDVAPNSERLRQLLASASVFALPTLADLSSISSIEAMAMELPVVSTQVGGIPEIVSEGQTGYLVPPGDLSAFVARLQALTESPALRLKMGAAGRRSAEANHSMTSNLPSFMRILEED